MRGDRGAGAALIRGERGAEGAATAGGLGLGTLDSSTVQSGGQIS